MYKEELEKTARKLGYRSAHDQALYLIKEQLPDSTVDMSELATQAVNNAIKEQDSIGRVVGLRNF